MYNQNSPIMNNMMYQNNGMGYNIPPNPINNIVNLGNMGYNQNIPNMGGYYNNQYNNYYNPYFTIQQEEIRQAQLREEQKQYSNMMKKISLAVHARDNIENMDDFLSQYDPPQPIMENIEETTTAKLYNLYYSGSYGNPALAERVHNNNMMYERAKQEFPDTMGFIEFSNNSYKLVDDMLKQKQIEKERNNITKSYNANGFDQLVKMHSNSTNYFNSLFSGVQKTKDVNIDNLEITLPPNIYEKRKQEFMNAITQGL